MGRVKTCLLSVCCLEDVMPKALCFGSANIDETYCVPHMVAKGETLAATSVARRSGGKGLNQAVALARGGASTSFAGAIGADGAFLLEELANAGVDTSNVRTLENERTGVAIIQNDAEGDNCIILYPGANRCMTEERIDEALAGFGEGDLILLQNEINLVGLIIEKAHARGMKVALNPSPMDETMLQVPFDKVDYLLVNEIEATQLLGADDLAARKDWDAVAQLLGDKFPHMQVVLTLGGAGSKYIAGGSVKSYPALSKKVVDTTGAGDTFTGFLLAALLRGEDVDAAMTLAAQASAIAVSRPGAAPSIPTLDEVKAAQ